MTKKEILESIEKEIERFPDGGSFIFGYCVGDEMTRAYMGDLRDAVYLCEQIKIDAFNKQARREKDEA